MAFISPSLDFSYFLTLNFLMKDIVEYGLSNKALINHALSLRAVIATLYTRQNSQRVSSLFNNRLIVLDLNQNKSRLKVLSNHQLFMPPDDTSVSITFPEHLSYVLGCKNKSKLSITISSASNTGDRPKLAENITTSGQLPIL